MSFPGHRHRQHPPEVGAATRRRSPAPRCWRMARCSWRPSTTWPRPTGSDLPAAGQHARLRAWPARPCGAAWRSRWSCGTLRAALGSAQRARGRRDATATTTRTGWAPTAGWRWSARASACCAPAAPPRPALVVMVGTAVTVDALDADGPLPRRADPARLRPDAARAGDGHRRPEGADRRGGRLPHQHQRRADERRRQRHRRRHRAHAPQAAGAHAARSRCC